MERELEIMAYRGEPTPRALDWRTSVEYIAKRYLYASNRINLITKDAAAQEFHRIQAELNQITAAQEFERRCWENSAKRTLAIDHARLMYRQNKSIELADVLVDRLDWMDDECAVPVKMIERGANCTICGRFFNREHADRKPVFCEDCGCRLGWEQEVADESEKM